ncbi:MAG: ATP-binding protein [Fibrobacterota bacterium]
MWKRICEKDLKLLTGNFPCTLILGARQAGKTALSRLAFENAQYFDLESLDLQARIKLSPESFLRGLATFAILDEVQLIPELFPSLKVVIDEDRKRNHRFLLLGSAHPSILRNVSESLAGRVAILDLQLLSFRECATAEPFVAFNDFWLRGQFPETAAMTDPDFRFRWYDSYIRTFVERDLTRYQTGTDGALMLRLLRMAAHMNGGLVNLSNLSNALGINYHTVDKYLSILEGAFLIRRLPSYHASLKKRLVKAPRLYLCDTGMLHYFLGIRSFDELLDNPACGTSFEGFMIHEIMKNLGLGGTAPTYGFFRTQTGQECDLIIDWGSRRTAVEIKRGGRPDKEWLTSVRFAATELKCSRACIVHTGRESYTVDGVELIAAEDPVLFDKLAD